MNRRGALRLRAICHCTISDAMQPIARDPDLHCPVHLHLATVKLITRVELVRQVVSKHGSRENSKFAREKRFRAGMAEPVMHLNARRSWLQASCQIPNTASNTFPTQTERSAKTDTLDASRGGDQQERVRPSMSMSWAGLQLCNMHTAQSSIEGGAGEHDPTCRKRGRQTSSG